MSSKCAACRDEIALPFEFKMAFQPIVDLARGRVWGYEALVRGANGEPALFVLDQDFEQMFGRDLLMPAPLRERLRGLDEPFGALGVFFEIHDASLSLSLRPVGAARTSSMGFLTAADPEGIRRSKM